MRINRKIFLVLVGLVSTILSGCPAFDPYTESRLINETNSPIQVTLTLDKTRYGLESTDDATKFAEEWFQEFAEGEDTQLIQSDVSQLTATYEIRPSGFMVVHSSLGTEPYFHFNLLKVSAKNQSKIFKGLSSIKSLFERKDEKFYHFVVSKSTLKP